MTVNLVGSFDDRGSTIVETATPSCLAFGGMFARKILADRALGEKGLNLVEISVMNRVIIVTMASWESVRCEI